MRRRYRAGTRSRISGRTAVAASAAVLAGGLFPGSAAAQDTQAIDVELTYTCRFPTGSGSLEVLVTGELPARAKAGRTIQPKDVTTAVTVPAALLSTLADGQAAEVSARTQLATTVSQKDKKADADWIGAADRTAVPDTGDVTLTAKGEVPAVTPPTGGDLTITAGRLTIDFSSYSADGTGADPETVSCSPDDDQPLSLATVPVTPVNGTAPPEESAPGDPSATEKGPGTADANPRTDGTATAEAPECFKDPNDTWRSLLGAYMTGVSNVRKLNGASIIPLTCTRIKQGSLFQNIVRDTFPDGSPRMRLVTHSEFWLSHNGKAETPPSSSTFLTYGFMPTTATMVLEQTEAGVARNALQTVPTLPIGAELRTYLETPLRLRLYDVRVNGKPLDVGDECRTTGPLYSIDPRTGDEVRDHIVLVGVGVKNGPTGFSGYLLTGGGLVEGDISIPPFQGCGVGEDLDSIFTAAISGPGNAAKVMQGQTCNQRTARPAHECTPDGQPVVIPPLPEW